MEQGVHYHAHKSPPLAPILSQKNSLHIATHIFLSIHFNIILSTPKSSKKTFLFGVSDQSF
jgi:hypothetical protein